MRAKDRLRAVSQIDWWRRRARAVMKRMKRWIVVVALAGCRPQPEPQYYAAQQPAYGGQAPGQQPSSAAVPPPGPPAPYVAAQPNAQPQPAGSLQPQDPYAPSQPATRQPSQPTAPQPPSAPQPPVAQQSPAQPAPGEIQWYGKPPPAVLPLVKTAPPPPRTAHDPGTPTPGTQRPPTSQQPAPPPRPRKVDTRRFTFNGRAATQTDLETLSLIEAMYGQPAPQGDYWYDALSGAAGAWGGPTLGFLPAGLQLGGPLPANASGGGKGRLTGVFVNGRELHPIDVQVLTNLYGQVLPGRWWVDGQGNAGQEGGPPLLNLVVVARQRAAAGKGKGAESYYRSDGRGNNAFVGGGCVSTSTTTGSGDSKKNYDYYSAGC